MENQIPEKEMNQINDLLRKGFTPDEAFHKIGLLKEGDNFTEAESKIVLSLFQLGEFVDSVKTKEQYEEHKEEIDAIYEFLSSKKVTDYFSKDTEEMER